MPLRALADWLPAALAFAGALAPALLASGRIGRKAAQRIALVSLVALAGFAAAVVLLPLEAGETNEARWPPAFDAALAGALVALAALGVRRAFVVATWIVAAVALARAGGVVASLASTGQLTTGALTGAFLWLAAAILASVVALIRWRASPRSSPGDRSRAGSRRS